MSYSSQSNAPTRPGTTAPNPANRTANQNPAAPPPAQNAAPAANRTPALTQRQFDWAQAFMRAMGMGPNVGAQIVDETAGTAIGGSLAAKDDAYEHTMAGNLKGNSGVEGRGEKVGRGLHGAGSGYKTDVVKRVNEVVKRANAMADEGSVGKEIRKLIADLNTARDGYEERETGEQDKAKLDQRQRKVAAIESRIEALDTLLQDTARTRMIDVTHMNDAERTDALVKNPAILATLTIKDPTDPRVLAAIAALAQTNPAAFAGQPEMAGAYLASQSAAALAGQPAIMTALFKEVPNHPRVGEVAANLAATNLGAVAENPVLARAFLATKPEQKKVVALLGAASITAVDRVVSEVMAASDGSAQMNALCAELARSEAEKPGQLTALFRGNSAATKLTKAFAVSGPEGTAFASGLASARNQAIAGMPKKVEIDPAKIGPDDGDPRQVAAQSVQFIERTCTLILRSVYQSKVPPNVATSAYVIAAAARKTKLSDEDIGIIIGGHLLLRIINPLLVQTPKPGGAMLGAGEQRLMVLVTKVIQNISNHIVNADPSKEKFMADLVGYQKAQIPAMDRWCAQVTENGRAILEG